MSDSHSFRRDKTGQTWETVEAFPSLGKLREYCGAHLSAADSIPALSGHFSPYGAGNVQAVYLNNKFFDRGTVLGFHIYGMDDSDTAKFSSLEVRSLLAGISLHPTGNIVTVDIQDCSPDGELELTRLTFDFRIKEYQKTLADPKELGMTFMGRSSLYYIEKAVS